MMRAIVPLALALLLGGLASPILGVATAHANSVETIVFVRHGEKPLAGLGQLDCKGLNRSLALPGVIQAQFGKPKAIFAPNPSKRKDDVGKPYDYVRPLATIEPTAIRLGLPVDTSLGYDEADKLIDALEQSAYHDATVVVAWEHKVIDVLVKTMVSAHGGQSDTVPEWSSLDFDGIFIVKITWTEAGSTIAFTQGREGLDNLPATCPN